MTLCGVLFWDKIGMERYLALRFCGFFVRNMFAFFFSLLDHG